MDSFLFNFNKSCYFDSLGGQPDKCLFNHLTKPITYDNYKIQGKNFKLCGSYCLCFFYPTELPDPISLREAASKLYVDNNYNDPSVTKNNIRIDFNDTKRDDVRFVKINSLPAVRKHLKLKFFVDEAISHSVDESSFLRLEPNEKLKLDEQD